MPLNGGAVSAWIFRLGMKSRVAVRADAGTRWQGGRAEEPGAAQGSGVGRWSGGDGKGVTSGVEPSRCSRPPGKGVKGEGERQFVGQGAGQRLPVDGRQFFWVLDSLRTLGNSTPNAAVAGSSRISRPGGVGAKDQAVGNSSARSIRTKSHPPAGRRHRRIMLSARWGWVRVMGTYCLDKDAESQQ